MKITRSHFLRIAAASAGAVLTDRIGSPMWAQQPGAPYLVISTSSRFTQIWSTSKNHGGDTAAVWRPAVGPGQFIIGDLIQQGYQNPTGSAMVVSVANASKASEPLLLPPTGYTQIWNDSGSGGSQDGSIWFPIPPSGYVSIGCVAADGYDPPSIPSYRCVLLSRVTPTTASRQIWNDSGSHAHSDVGCWAINGVPNAFVAQGNYDTYNGSAYMITPPKVI